MTYMKKIALLTAVGATAMVMTACSDNNEKPKTDKATENEKTEETAGTNKENSPKKEHLVTYAPETEMGETSLFVVDEELSYIPAFHTEGELSPDERTEALVEGRGESGIEEGIGTLVIHQLNSDTTQLITWKDEGSQHTIKDLEWIDNERLFVIVGQAYGTVTQGGQLYELTLSDLSAKRVFPSLSENEEIVSIHRKDDNSFTYVQHTYEDENFTTGKEEEKELLPNK